MVIRSKCSMLIGFSQFNSERDRLASQPNPGEIWQLCQPLQSDMPDRYGMIVKVLELEAPQDERWQAFSIMVFSQDTTYLSDVDVLILPILSGLNQDLLAQTWHVLPILECYLQHRIGNRLSRRVYDQLMAIGDAYHSLIPQAPPRSEVEALGLVSAPSGSHHQSHIQAFHQQELAWTESLSTTFTEYQTYLRSLLWADVVLTRSFQAEQTLQTVELSIPAIASTRSKVILRNWLQHWFESDWFTVENLTHAGILHLAPLRVRTIESGDESDEIRNLICQLAPESAEVQRRRVAKQLGEIAQGNSEAIQALINLLRSTEDDETLWTAVESLWQIDPGNPAARVRRVRLLDLGLQAGGQTVAMAVAMIQKSNQRVGIMLRVYPTGDEPYLPENLKLILFNDFRQTYEVTARRNDLYIQLKFTGQSGEPFSVQIHLREASITEDFVL